MYNNSEFCYHFIYPLKNCRRNYQVQDYEGTRPQIQKSRRKKKYVRELINDKNLEFYSLIYL